jgi:predicted DCC family thiol-disulfide oxidoreductase YuxK
MTSPSTHQEPSTADTACIEPSRPAILFFDGVCGMCNTTVDFVSVRDTQGLIHFAPIQGETAKSELPEQDIEQLSTVAFKNPQGKLTKRSSAIVRLLWTLGGKWKLVASLLWLIPKPLRDLGYVVIAKNRYRLFGKRDFCRLPSPAEQARILN